MMSARNCVETRAIAALDVTLANRRAKVGGPQAPTCRAKAVANQPAKKSTRPLLDSSYTAALVTVRGEIDRSVQRHPDLWIDCFFIDEKWPASEDQRRVIMDAFHSIIISEDDNDRWCMSADAKLWSRFRGDVSGVEEFARLARSVGLILQSARIISGKNVEMPIDLILYLAVCRPTPLLEAEIDFCCVGPSKTSPVFQNVRLRHSAFVSLRAAVDFILSPSEVAQLPATENIRPSVLPNSDCMVKIVANFEGRPANPSKLFVGDHFIMYRGRRCDFEPGYPFEIFKHLTHEVGKHFTYAELSRAVWPVNANINDNRLQAQVTIIRKILKAANIEGIKIKGTKGHYQLVLT